MEKKAPERKVRLREGDVFYVYDKRINKCIKENCEGTVKYGLILKVIMPNGDALNTYECNKCHMKYTAYPNYVRLTEADGLCIHNREEVEARDRKRAADAVKHAAKGKRKPFKRRTEHKTKRESVTVTKVSPSQSHKTKYKTKRGSQKRDTNK